ncbi:MAG TPA: phosphotransferase family protein [Acidimicrobiales bacterium]|nr:phosphotransferase family protein [Acidimicrobiales bacterium]
MAEQVKGISEPAVSAWLAGSLPGAEPPFEYELVAGGRSNLTYVVTDARGRRWALRRPPLGRVVASAHDVTREHRLLQALHPTPVPVPEPVACCEDLSVNDAPFYVMEFVDGLVVRNRRVGRETLAPGARRVAAESVVDVLADLHTLDADAVGLGALAARDDYVARQLKRFRTQWEQSRSRDLDDIDGVYKVLIEHLPDQPVTGIVHGDYRLDNCVVGPDGVVRAVLDWELCTLGDVLADLAMLLVSWTRPHDDAPPWPESASVLDGFPEREELVARYVERCGHPVDDLAYYQAFALWKLACISEGVYSRYKADVMGRKAEVDLSVMDTRVRLFASAAAQWAERIK